MSDTPKTDSLAVAVVPVLFARQLERELAAANARIKRLEKAGDAMAETTTTPDAIAWRRAKEARP